MAFTSTLEDVGNPYRAIDPGPKASPIAEIAKLAGGLMGALDQNSQRASQERSAAALDEVAAANYEYKKGANAALKPSLPMPIALGGQSTASERVAESIPREVAMVTDRLVAVGRAVEQKAVTPVAYDLQLETRINDLMQKYPESAYEISNYMQAAGIDSVIFRDLKAQEDRASAQESAVNEGVKQKIQVALNAGSNPDMPQKDLIKLGSDIQVAQMRIASKKAEQDATDRDLQLSEAQRKETEKRESDDWLRTNVENTGVLITPLLVQSAALTNATLEDPTGVKFGEVSAQLYPKVQSSLVIYRNESINNYMKSSRATPEGATRLAAHIDSQIAAVKDLYVGDASVFKMKQNVYNGMQTTFGINAQQALPVYSMLMADPGTAAILKAQFALGGSPTLNPKVIKDVTNEINGYTPGAADGMDHLKRAGKILTGELNLEDVSPQEAASLIQTTIPSFFGIGNDVRSGKASDGDKQQYLNVSNNLINAARTTSPSEKITPSMEAISKVASLETLQGLEIIAKDPRFKQAATESLLALRGTTFKNLEAVRDSGSDVSPNGIWRQVYSNEQQKFILQPDRKAYNRLLANVGGGQSRTGNTLGSFESQTMPTDMIKRVNLMNQYVKVLSWSAKWDESIPKGTGQKELNNRYANGIPLPTVAGQAGQTTQERVDQARGAIENLLGTVNTGAAVNLAQTQSATQTRAAEDANPMELAVRVALAEDAKNPVGTLSVIMNRAAKSGKSLTEVIRQPKQFEAYNTGDYNNVSKAEIDKLMKRPDIQAILQGQIPKDYQGVDSFYAPGLQADKNRKTPTWDKGQGFDVGQTRFFRGLYQGG